MMPAISAQERLARARDIALGNGNLEENAARDLIGALERRAAGPNGARARAAKAGDLAGMGIGVRSTGESDG